MYGRVGYCGSTASPSRPLSQKLYTSARRSATTVGVGVSGSSVPRPVRRLITPAFSATKISPLAANWTLVGSLRPVIAAVSLKPAGRTAATSSAAVVRGTGTASPPRTTAMTTAATSRADLADLIVTMTPTWRAPLRYWPPDSTCRGQYFQPSNFGGFVLAPLRCR